MQRGGRTTNPLYMHPDDATARRLESGSAVRVHNTNGSIDAVIDLDDTLVQGVVAMVPRVGPAAEPGHVRRPGRPRHEPQRPPALGPGSFEPLSSRPT